MDLAGLHVAQGLTHQLEELSVASLRPTQEGEVDGFGVGELLRATPAAVLAVHGAQQGLCRVIQDLFRQLEGLEFALHERTGHLGRGSGLMVSVSQELLDRLSVLLIPLCDQAQALEERGRV